MLATILALCLATDGDSLRCGKERIRLLGIDAPEMAGHCRKGRACVPGDPIRSRDNLRAAIKGKQLRIERLHMDRYGRTIAIVYAGTVNLSCAQLQSGYAIYKPTWDKRRAVAQACGDHQTFHVSLLGLSEW